MSNYTFLACLLPFTLIACADVSSSNAFTGTLISFTSGAASSQTISQLTGEAATFPRNAAWLLQSLAAGQGRALIVFGLLLLIATPVLRVLLSLTVFARQRDWPYVAITAVVLVLLGLSFVLGKAAL